MSETIDVIQSADELEEFLSEETIYYICCDGCNRDSDTSTTCSAAAREYFNEGWRVVYGELRYKVLCPTCGEKAGLEV